MDPPSTGGDSPGDREAGGAAWTSRLRAVRRSAACMRPRRTAILPFRSGTLPIRMRSSSKEPQRAQRRTKRAPASASGSPRKGLPPARPLSFETPRQLEQWLRSNHEHEQELWVRIFKKESGTPTVTWNDCVIAAIAWGWIDGHKKSLDEVSFLQRLTPRRPRSSWSKKNCEHAERLIAEGRMQPSGLAHVEAARRDGRWDSAYSGSSEMVIPDDFLAELQKNPAAKKFFATLDRRNLYSIYHRLQTAKRPETRQRRIANMLADLARGKPFH